MTSLERVQVALRGERPDRVPFFILANMHGAREIGVPLSAYFRDARKMIEGQSRLQARYRSDCASCFMGSAIELEAWGSEAVLRDDGPPDIGPPILARAEDIVGLERPRVMDAPCLRRVLEVLAGLRARCPGVAVLGVAISPFMLASIQLGFELYLELLQDRPEMLERLVRVNEEFTVEWANAQLAAGATLISYFEPLCSPRIIPPEIARRTSFPSARRALARIRGPVSIGLASNRGLPVIEDLCATGATAVGVSALEDLADIKTAVRGRIAVIGNLSSVEMCRWDPATAEAATETAIRRGAPGGGYILADDDGDLPWNVADEVLETVADAVERHGAYPLDGRGERT